MKKNPQHTVPTIDDDGYILWESRAIAIYLVEKFFPNGHSIYPKDAKSRALINQYLHFDVIFYQRLRLVAVSIQIQTMFCCLIIINCDRFDSNRPGTLVKHLLRMKLGQKCSKVWIY